MKIVSSGLPNHYRTVWELCSVISVNDYRTDVVLELPFVTVGERLVKGWQRVGGFPCTL